MGDLQGCCANALSGNLKECLASPSRSQDRPGGLGMVFVLVLVLHVCHRRPHLHLRPSRDHFNGSHRRPWRSEACGRAKTTAQGRHLLAPMMRARKKPPAANPPASTHEAELGRE